MEQVGSKDKYCLHTVAEQQDYTEKGLNEMKSASKKDEVSDMVGVVNCMAKDYVGSQSGMVDVVNCAARD